MKKQFFLMTFFLTGIFVSCKNNEISQNETHDKVNIIEKPKVQKQPDTISQGKLIKVKNNNLVNLPFDFEEKDKLANSDEAKFAEVYPTLKEDKLEAIKKIIYLKNEDNPDQVFQINNGGLSFDTYVYCTYGDSDSQTVINVKNGRIFSNESIGYAMPENETYQSFLINKDLSILVYDINYNSRSKKVIEKYQIKQDGLIIKTK